MTPLVHSPVQLVLADLVQYGWCMVPNVLPVLLSSARHLPAFPCSADGEGWCQQLCAAGRMRWIREEGSRLARGLTDVFGALSALQGRDLDSYICQIVTMLSTLKPIVNNHDERQQHLQI